MMMPVIDSSAGMIPRRKMSVCQTGPMPVPSCQRRMVRATVSGGAGGGGLALAVSSSTGMATEPKLTFHLGA